ncbi:fluoride efflux transporter CrcB [Sulfurovum sp. zt1-1]|uniref:Fluoride-specific ion channel FluC n=1 Tax=Sulfurovum zhangzhouensis TaxID=3019067 RepID=A0ABT7QVV0_9BACT|nr:fluoride efflux transporter CrcB [Sulfurovum zhangzhouensis]MDM5270669.1 fluoride efflux transporter CrcB [Sulfurovum zhangzhouensis]
MSSITIIAVASGGAIGATLRLLINGIVNKHFAHVLPLGTLAVNLIGSLLIGMLFAYFHHNSSFPPYIKTFLVTGILGALTTYSTFAIESFFLLEAGHFMQAFANIVLNLFGTILLAGLGYLLVLNFTK